MTPDDARDTLRLCRILPGSNFHALGSDEVGCLLERAKAWKYRTPRNANGSRARCFHAYLERLACRA
jgi:hypothetical protein